MKKIIFTFALAFIAFASNAQCYLGGTLGLTIQSMSVEGETESATAIAIVPEVSYKFNNKWAIGLNLGIAKSSTSDIATITCSPYARFTFAEKGPVNFFAEGVVGYEGLSYDDHNLGGVGIALRPGMTIDLSEKIHLIGRTTLLQYSTVGKNIKITQTGFAINPSFEFGIMFKI